MITVQDLTFSYKKDLKVLSNVSFSTSAGEVLAVMGHNGSGKSTLFKLIARILVPQNGSIQILDQDIESWKVQDLFSKIGILFSNSGFYSHLSVLDNFRILASYRGIKFDHVIENLELLEVKSFMHKRVGALSTGMKQKASIAASIMHNPDIIILDEPIIGLDPAAMVSVRELILELKRRGKTIIMASHILSEIERIADNFIILSKGEVVKHGRVNELTAYKDLEQMYLEIYNESI